MDYANLMQLTAPGQDPYGPVSAERVNRWETLNNANLGAIPGATSLAQLGLEKEQQLTKEFMAGAPGRMNNIQYANKESAAKLEGFDKDQFIKRIEQDIKEASLRENYQNSLSGIMDVGSAYVNAKTPDEVKKIKDASKGRKLRNNYVMGTDDTVDDAVLTAAGLVAKSDPKLVNKETVANTTATAGVEKARMAAEAAQTRMIAQMQMRQELEKMKFTWQKELARDKPLSLSAGTYKALQTYYGDDVEGMLNAMKTLQGVGPNMNLQNKVDLINKLAPGLIQGNVSTTGTDLPKPKKTTAPPNTQPKDNTPVKLEVKDLNKDMVGKVFQYDKDKQSKIIDIQINKNGTKGRIILEDGKIITTD